MVSECGIKSKLEKLKKTKEMISLTCQESPVPEWSTNDIKSLFIQGKWSSTSILLDFGAKTKFK